MAREKKGPMQLVRIMRVETGEEQKRGMLVDQDYWLASLHDAMERNDKAERMKCKKQLRAIGKELQRIDDFLNDDM